MTKKPKSGGVSSIKPENPTSWSLRWALYERAAELPSAEWQGYLKQHAFDETEALTILRMLEDPHNSLREFDLSQDLEPAIDRTGVKVGRYRVQGRLGKGGMAEVYAAFDEDLSRPVALKFMRSSEASRLARLAEVMREAKAASALNHPHIVMVHEVIPHEDSLVIVMELVSGNALRTLCGVPLSIETVIGYGKQIGLALAAAHAAGIVHRDVKPENLMVRPDGYVKLLDFGLAREFGQDGAVGAGQIAGTLRYMSPEQVQGKTVTSASDVFSLGVVLYELVTGRHPFAAPSLLEVLQKVTLAQPTALERLNSKAPIFFTKLIGQMLEKDPAVRPSSKEVVERLNASSASPLRWWIAATSLCALIAAILAVLFFGKPLPAPAANFAEETFLASDSYVTAAALSPDGTQVAYAQVDGSVLLRNCIDKRERLLAAFHNERIEHLSWTSGGPRLLVSSEDLDAQTFRVSSIDISTGQKQILPVSGAHANFSPDATRIAFLAPSRLELWTADADGTKAARLYSMQNPSELTDYVWSPTGRLLHYFTAAEGGMRLFGWAKSIMRTLDSRSGKVVASQDLPALSHPFMLHDGRLLFLAERTRDDTIFMEAVTDPATGRLTGTPHSFSHIGQSLVGNFAASADGKTLSAVLAGRDTSFLSYADLVPGSAKLGRKYRFLSEALPDLPHAWAPDNATIFFESYRFGNWHIFSHRVGQRSSEKVVDLPKDQFFAQISPDGRWLLFLSGPVSQSGLSAGKRTWNLMRLALAGGEPELVPNCGPIQEFACLYKAARCVIREYRDGRMTFFEMSPEKGKGRVLGHSDIQAAEFGDWSMSPDGSMIAIVNLFRNPVAIRIIYLDKGFEREIPIKGASPTHAVALTWSPDGKGWYLPVAGDRMRKFDWEGHSQFVDDLSLWLVPTTDGKRVAFQDQTHSNNVWICRR